MSTIVTRAGKGSPLTNNEVDANFTNLNTDKLESADLSGYALLTGATFTGEVEATGFNGDLTGAILFKGQAGEALTKGDPAYISGISGNKTIVSKADANDASKMPCFGIVDATVSANADCSIVTFGTLQGLDTSSFSEGDELYISDTGTLTTTAPTGEASQIQKIGKVTRSHASTGSIKVMGAGRTNATPNLDDGNFFLGNGSNQSVSADFETSVTGIALPLTGGTLTGDLNFGDNDKATFGAGSDLQIYHNGSDSYIDEQGLGNLYIRGSNDTYILSASGEPTARFTTDGAVTTYYDGSAKLATTSTGIDVTGTATMDGLTVDGDGSFKTGSGAVLTVGTTNASAAAGQVVGQITFDNADISGNKANAEIRGMAHDVFGRTNIDFRTGDSGSLKTRALVSWNGDISFYEDTGTTPKFHWSSSAESLGIGTSSPARSIHSHQANAGATNYALFTNTTTGSTSSDGIVLGLNATSDGYLWNYEAGNLIFGTSATERMRIDSSGKVGIGTSTPAKTLTVEGTGLRVQSTASADFYSTGQDALIVNNGTANLRLWNNGAERMRIDASGNLLVGTTAQYGQGLSLNANATAYFRKAGDAPLTLRRDSTDGSILNFYKDGTAVGSIGVSSSNNLTVGSSASGHAGFELGNQYLPLNGGSASNGELDLGSGTRRFKDLYLSGGLRVDGTDSLRPSTDDSLINISGGSASNSGANYALFGETHASLAGVHRWRTNGSERMRIDSSGNLLVGKTSADVDTAGTCLRGSISSIFTVDGNVDTQVAIFNRKSNDGTIADFRKDGTTVGSIGTKNGYLQAGTADTQLAYVNSDKSIRPFLENGSNSDGNISLGVSGARFKDLHLSGTANVGSIALGDNGQATFGASDDLKIYHDGSNSYVTDTGTGNLFIGGSSYVDIGNGVTGMGGQTYARFNTSGSCQLNYNGVSRLTTTSAGVDVNGSITIAGGITEDAETLTGTATTIDLATATNFTHTLTGATTYTFSNPATTGNATAFTLKVIQDTTARTITWPASVDWAGGTAPTLTATSGGVDVFVFYTIDGGTTYYGFTAGQAMA